MTDDRIDLDAIRARAQAATPGPWAPYRTRGGQYVTRPDLGGVAREWSLVWEAGDAEFIAHAREDVPRLLAEVERLRVAHDAEYTQGRLHYDRAERLEAGVGRLRDEVDDKARDGRLRLQAVEAERDHLAVQVQAVRALCSDVGNEHTGPVYVACSTVLAALEGSDQ